MVNQIKIQPRHEEAAARAMGFRDVEEATDYRNTGIVERQFTELSQSFAEFEASLSVAQPVADVEPTEDQVRRAAEAMAKAVIRDDEGEFPRLFDLLDYSGENKAWTVTYGLARAALLSQHTVAEATKGWSRCDKCGAQYPTAPAGTVHKCGMCSGGFCQPVGQIIPTHYVLPRGTNSMVKVGSFFEEQRRSWGNDGWKLWVPVCVNEVLRDDGIEAARELAAHMTPIGEQQWTVLRPHLPAEYAMNPESPSYRACQNGWKHPYA